MDANDLRCWRALNLQYTIKNSFHSVGLNLLHRATHLAVNSRKLKKLYLYLKSLPFPILLLRLWVLSCLPGLMYPWRGCGKLPKNSFKMVVTWISSGKRKMVEGLKGGVELGWTKDSYFCRSDVGNAWKVKDLVRLEVRRGHQDSYKCADPKLQGNKESSTWCTRWGNCRSRDIAVDWWVWHRQRYGNDCDERLLTLTSRNVKWVVFHVKWMGYKCLSP